MKQMYGIFLILGLLLAGCTSQPAPPQVQPSQQLGLLEYTFTQMLSTSTPLKCIVHPQGGSPTLFTLFLLNNKMKVETNVGLNPAGKLFSDFYILKNDKILIHIPSSMKDFFMQQGTVVDCDFVEYSTTSSGGIRPVITPQDLAAMPSTNYQCQTNSFGEEMFATQGKVCTSAEWDAQLTR